MNLTPDMLVPLPVVVPLTAAGMTLVATRRTRTQRLITVSALTLTVAVSAALVYLSDTRGPQVVNVGGWSPLEGIVLIADRLASLMLLVSVVVTLAVVLFSIGRAGPPSTRRATVRRRWRSSTRRCWCSRRGSPRPSSRATCSTCTSASRCCWRPASCC